MSFRAPLRPVLFAGRLGLLAGESAWSVSRLRIHAGDLLCQLREVGINSLPVVLVTILFSAATFAYHLQAVVRDLGMRYAIGGLVGLATAREVAPVMCAVCVIARCGSAMAAELGTMKVTEQIDALRALSVSPVEYLVVPRLLGTAIMMPVHYAYGLAIGLLGAIVVGWGGGVTTGMFLTSMAERLRPGDLWGGALKVVVFGIVLALVCCERGLQADGGSRGVGRATTSAVVISLLMVYGLNYVIDMCLW